MRAVDEQLAGHTPIQSLTLKAYSVFPDMTNMSVLLARKPMMSSVDSKDTSCCLATADTVSPVKRLRRGDAIDVGRR